MSKLRSLLNRQLTLRESVLFCILLLTMLGIHHQLSHQYNEEDREESYREYGRFFVTAKHGDTLENLTERAVKARMIRDDDQHTHASWVVGRANPNVTNKLTPGDRVAIPITEDSVSRVKMFYDFGGFEYWVGLLAIDRRDGESYKDIAVRCEAIGAVMIPCGSHGFEGDWSYDFNPGRYEQKVWLIPIFLQKSEIQSIGMLQALWDVRYGENHGATATLVEPVPR